MRDADSQPVRLADYRPPEWLVDTVELDVCLHPTATSVRSKLTLRPNPEGQAGAPLVLDGDELAFVSFTLDGAPLDPSGYAVSPTALTIKNLPARPLVLEIETLLNPSANTKLMGLYRSGKSYCTQCEAEGFRRITYFPDRPDVLSIYTTRIEADVMEAPVLLGNGNPVESGPVAGTSRHYAVWHDPWPKPCYLFALVGGALDRIVEPFTTASGRTVELGIYVEPGKTDRASYAMDALKRSMRWDEETFGCEYDLDVFNIVAVADFNMGAMENKGLNIFNDKYILATPETATDVDYARIEGIIAHEYFHNWTGNRITCRDWFQLCLKEGLTVFRDQEFSSDERSRPVKRIDDVRVLKSHQFAEDSGPLAHSVRPDTYREINNFYTATVYEKGAEIIRMLKTLLGSQGFRAGMDLYFERHDGDAATVEDFLTCFSDATGADLRHFTRWYSQAGTPRVNVETRWDKTARTFALDISQQTLPTPGQPVKQTLTIPLVVGLLGPDGSELPLIRSDATSNERSSGILVLEGERACFTFADLPARPILSINRGFSAPIELRTDLSTEDLLFLARHDSDAFNRFDAAQTLAMGYLVATAAALREGKAPADPNALVAAVDSVLADHSLDAAFVAQALSLPSENDIAREIGHDVDPDAVAAARKGLRQVLGGRLAPALIAAYERLAIPEPYAPDAVSAGRRALKNGALDLLATARAGDGIARTVALYRTADNMTDRLAALTILTHAAPQEREAALEDFYARYHDDPLVVDKWLTLQALIAEPETLDRIRTLTRHPAFSMGNPNRVRSLIGAFAAVNPSQMHRPDGQAHAFVADTILVLDRSNPQLAARILGSFRSWRQLETVRRTSAENTLRRIAQADNLSSDVSDIVMRALG
ncbi:aminopeptidase N [Ancylobacter crimeensis]